MALFKIHPKLREAYRLQRQAIFGKNRYWLHLLSWCFALVILIFQVGDDVNKGFNQGMQDGAHTSRQQITVNGIALNETPYGFVAVVAFFAAAIMVYFFLLYAIPYARFKQKKRYLWLGFIINLAFWLAIIVLSGIIIGLKQGDNEHVNLEKDSIFLIAIIASIFSGVITLYFFSLYYFIDLYDQQKSLNIYKQILNEKLEAESQFLKTQINPHFLFNTLNNIYALVLNQSPDATFIAKELKNLMTYMLQDCKQDLVPLEGEIAFLKSYINLEKLRNKQEQINIMVNVLGDTNNLQIAPLLLINFIENAFKHGVKAGYNEAYVCLNIEIRNKRIKVVVENSKPVEAVIKKDTAIKTDGGIGIKNVKRRLDIFYPKKHSLKIYDEPNEYRVFLNISL